MTRALSLTLVAAAVFATSAVAVSAANRARTLVFYAKVQQQQFINHADDRARGNAINPFNADTKLPPPQGANTGKKGARAGDNALFSFKLFTDPGLTKSIGTATYSCTFNFAQQATCNVNIELTNGSMIASGPADLESGQFALALIGGTDHYLGARGQLTSTPTGRKNTTRLNLLLVGH
jgi:hypothetical protein